MLFVRHKSLYKLIQITLAFIAAGILYLLWSWNQGLNTAGKIYEVRAGTSLHRLSRQLYQDGVLPDRKSLVILAYLKGSSRQLKAGEYQFPDGITAGELLDRVTQGKVLQYPLVFLEGWNFKQMRRAMEQAPRLQVTLKDLSDAQIMRRLGYPDQYPEGRFYPDTYFYSSNSSDVTIFKQAYEKLAQRLAQEWDKRAADLPLKTPYEALILASIIEKETGQASERPLIAGVFINRLRINMRLQTDPTVIYGMGERFDGDIRSRDLKIDTPYNTYTRAGLPPTPIAMPSGEAIHAALHPADTKALYFVSRGDGSHVFSETLEQHNAAVRQYQLGR